MSEVPTQRPIALVTGASRPGGIGAAICTALATAGWDVARTYHVAYDERMSWGAEPDAVGEVSRQISESGADTVAFDADLVDPPASDEVLEHVVQHFGRPVTALVLCHCESVDSTILDTTVDSFDRHYAVNVRASWLLIRAFARQLPMPCREGRIVALTSDATVGNIPYGTTKGALDRLVLAAAHELAAYQLTANAINPGATETGWITPQLREQIVRDTALGRVGEPIDAARLVAFLCSPEGGWVNGQLISSNGGTL